MIDECSIWIPIAQKIEPVEYNVRESFEYCGMMFHPHPKNKPVLTYICDQEGSNLHFTIKQDRLYIRNSFHKFYTGGENYTDYRKSDLHETLLILGDQLQTDMLQANIMKMSLSLNIDTSFHPMEFIRSVSDYKTARMEAMKLNYHSGDIYGKRAILSDYKVKVYTKTHEGEKDRLRIEKTSLKSRYFKKGTHSIRMNYFEDFFRPEFNEQYQEHILETINHFYFMDNVITENLSTEEMKYWFILTHPSEEARELFIKKHGRAYRDGIRKLKNKTKDYPSSAELMSETRPKIAEKMEYLLNN